MKDATGLEILKATSIRGEGMWEEYDFAAGMFRYFKYKNEFVRFSDYDVTNEWTLTDDGGVAGAAALRDDVDFGVLRLTPHSDDNDWLEIQFTAANAAGEFISLAANRALFFEVRIALSDATQSDVFVGLCITDADIHDTGTGVPEASDYIGFAKDDGDANWDFVAAKDSVETEQASIDTAVDDTHAILGFYIDGTSEAQCWIDGVAGPRISTNLPDDEQLCLTFITQNGEALAKNLDVDFVLAYRER